MTAQQFLTEMGIWEKSVTGQTILSLPVEKLEQLTDKVSSDDYLIHVDQTGFSVNFGNVGSLGIRYDFQ